MKEKISKKQLFEFGLLIGFGFPLLIGWLLPSLAGHGFRSWTLWVSLPAFIFGLTSPRLLYFPYKGWIALGHALGWVNSKIILSLVFIIVLQPIAFIMFLIGHDPLRRRRKGAKTYRENQQNHQPDLTRIF